MHNISNPFVFGEIVTDDAFCDREAEQKNLLRDMKDSQKVFLISPRRYGKTSLLKKVLRTLKKERLITVYIDLYRASSLSSFLELYCSSIASASETVLDKAINFISDVLPRLRPKITVDSNGAPSIGIEPLVSKKEALHALSDAFELPAIVAKRKRKKVVVVLDEFQEIANFDGESLEKAMRSYVQGHRTVGYIFSGSKKHMLEDMTMREDRAFYRIGKVIYLNKIPQDIFHQFLKKKFKKGGFTLHGDVVGRVLDITEDIPYNAQFMCHELWNRFLNVHKVSLNDVDVTLAIILDEQTPFFIQQWDSLPLNHRGVLKAIAMRGGSGVFSHEFAALSGIGSVATLQTAVKLLVKKYILEKQNGIYSIGDVFFREWVKRR